MMSRSLALMILVPIVSALAFGSVDAADSPLEVNQENRNRVSDRPDDNTLIFPLQDKHVHSSSIIECPNGDLLVTWYHGSGERRANDVQIQGARSRDSGRTWSPIFVMADSHDLPDCNPVLFVDSKDRLWLFWLQVVANGWQHGLLKYRRSIDYQADGPPTWEWQDVIVLKPGDRFPNDLRDGFEALQFSQDAWGEYARPYDELVVAAAADPAKRQKGWMPRNHLAVLPSGRILLPLYSDGFNVSLAAISDDLGETWRASRPMAGVGPIQPTIVQCTGGELVAYFRDSGGPPHRVQVSRSNDDGLTWSPARDTDLPNPSGSLEVIRLHDGDWAMIYNDTESGRHQLAMALSRDEGATWSRPKYLEHDRRGSFGYPSLIETRDHMLHATYSLTRTDDGKHAESIKHVTFAKEWITTDSNHGGRR